MEMMGVIRLTYSRVAGLFWHKKRVFCLIQALPSPLDRVNR